MKMQVEIAKNAKTCLLYREELLAAQKKDASKRTAGIRKRKSPHRKNTPVHWGKNHPIKQECSLLISTFRKIRKHRVFSEIGRA